MTDIDDWYVLIFEDLGGGQYRQRQLAEALPIGADLDEAREAALDEARTYAPNHPAIEKTRWVFQTSPNTWVVNIEGAASFAYFEVQVAQLVAAGDAGELEDNWPDV